MWNREEGEDDVPQDTTSSPSDAEPGRSGSGGASGRAVIGNSIRIQGEVTGDEDLTIQGHVDGSVELDEHEVTIGPDGEVEADIVARVVTVEGRVRGDLTAEEQIIVRSSARVEGDLLAPRVVLEDGAHFRGGVEMEERSARGGGRTGAASTPGSRSAGSDASPASTASSDEEESGGETGDETAA